MSYNHVESWGKLIVVIQRAKLNQKYDDLRRPAWREEHVQYEVKIIVEEEGTVVDMENVGDWMFLGKGCSRSCSSSLDKFGFFSKNCNYSIQSDGNNRLGPYLVVKFSLDKGKGKNTSTNLGECHSTSMPLSHQRPIWIESKSPMAGDSNGKT